MNETPSEIRDIVPATWRRPAVLLWVYLLPQIILAALNLRSFHLVAGEMSDLQRHQAYAFGGYALALMALQLGVYGFLRARQAVLKWTLAVPLLLAHVGYLWMTVAWLDRLIPTTVAFWMLPPERVLYHQFALVMPAVFHSALLLACFPTRMRMARDLGRTAILLLAIPAVWYVILHLAMRARRIWFDMPEVIVFLLIALSTLVLTGALLRLLAAGWLAIRRAGGHGRLLLIALVGVAGPLGGLWLNAYLPFPVDFQSIAVYVLAALNGLVLLLPGAGPRVGHRLVWLLQCAAFPFTLYFFVVFLPFLPLALLAVIAMGAGFLMLVPTALCLIHVSVLRDGWQATQGARGWRIAALLAVLVLPGLIATRAAQDRVALQSALDYLYEPTAGQHTFHGDVSAVTRSLSNLRDFKAGLQLPFLTEYYSQVVFGGLVLPEARMQDMHRAFTGHELEPPDESRMTNPLLGRGRNRTLWGRTRPPAEVPHDVVITSLQTEVTVEDEVERRLVTVQLTNRGPASSEFVAPIHVPPGTWVSGFWLEVEGQRVPGRLFEKKTALWVYEMIRDQTRRDPGLLIFRDPATVELRVFPFATNETRTVQIEFLAPDGFAAPIAIGERVGPVAVKARTADRFSVDDPAGRLWLVAPEAWRAQPAVERSAYLHVLVDRSAEGVPLDKVWPQVEAAARQLDVDRCVVSLANFEIEHLSRVPVSLREAKEQLTGGRLPARGGFCRDRAVKGALEWWQSNQPDAFPRVLVVSAATNTPAADPDLAFYASAWPGLDGYVLSRPDGSIQTVDWNGRERPADQPLSWTQLELEGNRHWVPVRGDVPQLVLDPGTKSAATMGPETLQSRYRQGARAWLLSHARWRNPGAAQPSLSTLVAASRASGVLVPATSYIVVENSAQWRFLEQSEKKKLAENSALEFRDAPEPSTWMLGGGFLTWMWYQRRKKCRGRCVVAPPRGAGKEAAARL